MKVGVAGVPVGQPGDGDVAEDAGQAAAVVGLDRAVGDAVAVADGDALLARGAGIEVVLEHLAQQPAALGVQAALQGVMIHAAASTPSIQPTSPSKQSRDAA